jgi:DNA primase
MRYPQTFIDDLRRQADIVRVIQGYVTLKKKGANWMACCPFHQEKTASFSVSPTKDIFYCFGCGKGGSVFNFVMEIERVSFPESIKIVAEKANVSLPVMVDDGKFEDRRKEADEVIQLNSWALEFWEAQLAADTREAQKARDYLQERGLTDETRKIFHLGYAPDSWDALLSHLKERGATETQIEQSGLVSKNEAGRVYDRFRGRLIIPIVDAQGRTVAFGGRTLDNSEPKYLNSPETAAYTKGLHLFGLQLARDEIRQKKFVILVEGYLDLIVPYQFGIRNMVASLGTALTQEQAKLLGRFARKVVVNYDGDSAGVKAAKRAIETLLAEDFETKILVLPEGADPDDFIRKNGVEAYHDRRGKALTHIQFVLEQAVEDRNLFRPADKAAAVEEALPFVRAVRNGIQKREYFDMTMDALRIEEPALRNELWQTIRKSLPLDQAGIKQKVAYASGARPTVAEHRLLERLVHDEKLRAALLPKMELVDYELLPTSRIFDAMIRIEAEGIALDFASLSAKTDDDPVAADLIPSLFMVSDEIAGSDAMDNELASPESCLITLRQLALDRRILEIGADLATAERSGDIERCNQLSMEKIELTQQLNALMQSAVASS